MFWAVLAVLAALQGGLLEDARAAGLAPLEAYVRAQTLFERLGLSEEPDPDLRAYQGVQTEAMARERLKALDPWGTFFRYLRAPALGTWSVHRDRDSRSVTDFSIRFASPLESASDARYATEALEPDLAASPHLPLLGLRIALDPGHIGGRDWDRRAGNFVRLGRGRVLSEGVLALQAALLLEERLTRLGAEVMLTRRKLAPVTELPYAKLDLQAFAARELRASAARPWFDGTLTSPEARSLFHDSLHARYFVLRADLAARVARIRDFRPDLTLVIHFDTSPGRSARARRGASRVRAFVAGGFLPHELATREARADFARHLLHPTAWPASVQLSRALVANLSRKLELSPDTVEYPHSVSLEPGVYARNLALTRRLTGHAVSYVECLRYDAPAEAERLARAERAFWAGGEYQPVSRRLVAVVDALEAGILEYHRGSPRL